MDLTVKEKRKQENFKIDLRKIICKTFYEFAKREPTQFNKPKKSWDYWATYWRFDRASMIAVDNILKEYDLKCK